jgi:hypothetical protein
MTPILSFQLSRIILLFMAANDLPDPDHGVTDSIAEAAAGKPFARPAAEGLAAMQRELQNAQHNLAMWTREGATKMINTTQAEIRDLTLRIGEYQAQLDAGKN